MKSRQETTSLGQKETLATQATKLATVTAKPRISDKDIQARDIGPPPPPPPAGLCYVTFFIFIFIFFASNLIRSSSRSDIQLISYVYLFRQQCCGQIYIFFLYILERNMIPSELHQPTSVDIISSIVFSHANQIFLVSW